MMNQKLVVSCFLLGLPMFGQEARMAGRVTGANEASVATVVVTVTQGPSGVRRAVLSNSQGYYMLGSCHLATTGWKP